MYIIRLIPLLLIFNILSCTEIKAQEVINKFYDNGELKCTYQLINGKLSGELKTYYASGILKEIGEFKDGLKNGVFKSYYSNGNGKLIEKYKNGIIKDTMLFFDKNKNLKFKIIIATGKYYEYYENEQLKEEGVTGKSQLENYSKKVPSVEVIGSKNLSPFLNKKNEFRTLVKRSSYRKYFPSGAVKVFFSAKNNKKEFYYENGSFRGFSLTKGIFVHGQCIMYHKNGTLLSKGNFVKGKRDGYWEWFYDNKKKNRKVLYDKNKLMEIVYKHDRNGKKIYGGNLKNGNGTLINFKKDQIVDTVHYKNGFPVNK